MRDSNKKTAKLLIIGPILLVVIFGALTGLIASGASNNDSKVLLNIDELMKNVLMHNEKKEHQKAIDLLLEAVEEHKEDPLLRTLLVQTFDLFLADEIRRGQESIQNNRKDQSAYLSVSGALELMGDNFRAMEMVLNGIAQKPSTDLWMRVANLELKSGRDLEALDVFREVIRLDNKNSEALNNAAFILSQTPISKDSLKEAEKLATRARELEPKNPEYIDTLAEVYFKKGDQVRAQDLIKEAIKLDPDSEEYKNRLESFETGQKDFFIAKWNAAAGQGI